MFPTQKLITEAGSNLSCGILPNSGFHEVVACSKVNKEHEDDELGELRHFSFKEYEGERSNKDDPVKDAPHLKPLKLRKQHIGTEYEPKLASIGDYWHEQTTKEIFDLLKEYEGLFPASVSELKGIKEDLGEMQIILKPDARPFKRRPYHLNLQVKEKVKREIDKMSAAGLIFPVDDTEWISPIIIQDKKDSDNIRVCVDYHSLKNACFHDPFPTPFSDQVLDNIASQEAYSFTNGFFRYHQVRIPEEDKKKTTFKFTIEWVSYIYHVMVFGLKDA